MRKQVRQGLGTHAYAGAHMATRGVGTHAYSGANVNHRVTDGGPATQTLIGGCPYILCSTHIRLHLVWSAMGPPLIRLPPLPPLPCYYYYYPPPLPLPPPPTPHCPPHTHLKAGVLPQAGKVWV